MNGRMNFHKKNQAHIGLRCRFSFKVLASSLGYRLILGYNLYSISGVLRGWLGPLWLETAPMARARDSLAVDGLITMILDSGVCVGELDSFDGNMHMAESLEEEGAIKAW